mmetsp:Transcript_26717/g.73504  ORF Transcript_26717/g.73504 Transcript_26717/m.73504 type:complete len:367 (+) Transcript_26717:81-1181(+)
MIRTTASAQNTREQQSRQSSASPVALSSDPRKWTKRRRRRSNPRRLRRHHRPGGEASSCAPLRPTARTTNSPPQRVPPPASCRFPGEAESRCDPRRPAESRCEAVSRIATTTARRRRREKRKRKSRRKKSSRCSRSGRTEPTPRKSTWNREAPKRRKPPRRMARPRPPPRWSRRPPTATTFSKTTLRMPITMPSQPERVSRSRSRGERLILKESRRRSPNKPSPTPPNQEEIMWSDARPCDEMQRNAMQCFVHRTAWYWTQRIYCIVSKLIFCDIDRTKHRVSIPVYSSSVQSSPFLVSPLQTKLQRSESVPDCLPNTPHVVIAPNSQSLDRIDVTFHATVCSPCTWIMVLEFFSRHYHSLCIKVF